MIKRIVLFVWLIVCLAFVPVLADSSLLQAVEEQRGLTESNPQDASLFNDLGNLLLLVDEEFDAEDAYRRAIEIDPEIISARFNLGLLLQQTEQPVKARREFRQLLKLDPEHAWSHYQVGVLDARRGRRDAAIRSYARAFRLDSRLTDPAFNPHILDNTLAASATLRAYADISSANLVPRTYESPRRIAGILVPEIGDRPTAEKKAERRRRRREKKAAAASPSSEEQEAKPAPEPTSKPAPKPPLRKEQTSGEPGLPEPPGD